MLKWIRRIILSLVGAIVLMILLLVGIVIFDGLIGTEATAYTNVQYEADDGTVLNSYLAMPEAAGSFPAVLMVHEWWGLNGEIVELANQMAAEGYVVLAPDTYRGPSTSQVPRALYLRLNVDEARVDSDMMAAFNYLTSLEEVDVERVAVIGFCYGGGVALRHGINNPDIDVTINLYGDTLGDAGAFGALLNEDAGSVLGIFGGVDPSIPLDEVAAFENALSEAGIEHQITVYDQMGHAFVQPDVINEPGQPKDAWEEILAYLDSNLASTNASES